MTTLNEDSILAARCHLKQARQSLIALQDELISIQASARGNSVQPIPSQSKSTEDEVATIFKAFTGDVAAQIDATRARLISWQGLSSNTPVATSAAKPMPDSNIIDVRAKAIAVTEQSGNSTDKVGGAS